MRLDGFAVCWLAAHGIHESGTMPPCDGRMARVHLIPQTILKRTDAVRSGGLALFDPRLWRWACGGIMGCTGHHGMFDMQKTLRVPFEALDDELLDLAESIGVGWWIERSYLPKSAYAMGSGHV